MQVSELGAENSQIQGDCVIRFHGHEGYCALSSVSTEVDQSVSEPVNEIATGDAHLREDGPVPWARTLADLLTISRLLGGMALAVMPWDKTVGSLGRLVKYNLLLWSTDTVDGKFARRSNTPPSWIGERDIVVDSALTLGTGIALARSGYLPGKMVVLWLGVCLVLYAMRPVTTTILVFMFPLQMALPVIALAHGCPEVRLYLIWVAAVAIMSWKRLKFVIESFIDGLPDRQREWIWSWLPGWLRMTSEERASYEMPEASTEPIHDQGSGYSV
jgi:phosphatidylglycerophosphate synthase